jgi:hypothetical protein
LIDWSKYQLVLLYLRYDDDANGVHEHSEFIFREEADGTDYSWKVLLRDRTQTTFQYRLKFVGTDPSNNREVPWTPTEDPILLVQ